MWEVNTGSRTLTLEDLNRAIESSKRQFEIGIEHNQKVVEAWSKVDFDKYNANERLLLSMAYSLSLQNVPVGYGLYTEIRKLLEREGY